MVYEVVWTENALLSYGENIDYLKKEWSEKEITQFIKLVERKLLSLSTHPYIGNAQNDGDINVRSIVIHKRITLVYQVSTGDKKVILILFGIHIEIQRPYSR